MPDQQHALSRLLVATINSREEEYARVSRLLHDEVGQVLSAVGLQLDVMKLDFKSALPELVPRIAEIQQMLDSAVRQVRTLSYDMNPAVVERAGLQYALERLVGRFRERCDASIRYLFDASVRVPLNVGNAWYKIAEHALDNAVRHAEATRIELRVRGGKQAPVLEVRDNGKGFPAGEARESSAGVGLLLMEHYAAAAGLQLEIKSKPGKGTVVTSVRPVQPGTEEQAQA